MQKNISRILVIRNDKLGDFMLAWPAFQFIKQAFPKATVYALVPDYTRPMAEICPWIDEIIIDDAHVGLLGLTETTAKLKAANIDAALNLHSTPRLALALLLAGIHHRFAPASRIDQIFYNHRLTQRRSRSEKPEYEYNIDLARFMASYYDVDYCYTLNPPLLKFSDEEIASIKNDFYSTNNIEPDRKLVFIHAGSGGSAINLSIEQYASLIKLLSKNHKLFFVLTAGPGEMDITRTLSSLITDCDHAIYYSTAGIVNFAKLLSIASLFVSGSTGTLHVAGVLNIPTASFYSVRRSATSIRWQSLNSASSRIAFTLNDDCDTTPINLEETANTILEHIEQ